MMTLVRAGGYPYNLLTTVFGEYTPKSEENHAYWEKKISQFVHELDRGGDKKIARDWYMCSQYFAGTITFKEIATSMDLSDEEVSTGIYRICEYLSMYWRENPNLSESAKCFLTMVIGRTGDTRAVDVLRAAGITSNRKLLTYCEKYGDGFERMPALKESSKKEIQSWVCNTCKSQYYGK